MAVPKKRTSKSKKNIRKNAWKQKVTKKATRALFLAKLVLSKGEISATEKVENS
nr:ribosomal protein L32 [Tetradesmus sp. JML-2023c]